MNIKFLDDHLLYQVDGGVDYFYLGDGIASQLASYGTPTLNDMLVKGTPNSYIEVQVGSGPV